jgi:hypothetical protein
MRDSHAARLSHDCRTGHFPGALPVRDSCACPLRDKQLSHWRKASFSLPRQWRKGTDA